MKKRYLIIGAGPTGLGAAHRLRELGMDDFIVLERHGHAGGLAASFKDDNGFTWDIGGHVVFSHYAYFDALLDSLLGDERLEHERESWVRSCATWVPYPFQNNIRHLPHEPRWECVEGLLPGNRFDGEPANFGQWIERVFGAGIAKHFMNPYNFKVWATPPELMQYGWIGERVSVVDLKRVLKNIILERDDISWGPNNTFKFPLHGGTGEIFRRLAARLDGFIEYNQEVAAIDADSKTVTTSAGLTVQYEAILNTAPVDILVSRWLRGGDRGGDATMIEAAGRLTHNSVHVAGVGLDIRAEDERNPRCWMYFPESDSPFYRVTNFHNYSPNNVARPGQQLAFMCETSYSAHKRERLDELMDRTIEGLVNTSMLDAARVADVHTRWETTVDYGYPVPCLERDDALKVIQPRLEAKDIYSRGRFGGWKYEVGNMDHSVMQGVEWADRMLSGAPETTYRWE
ncbi:MAG: FAD-dependent oxidoreductase [Pseudodesulfovibrio sp.]|uniref:Amine oxidase n=1 Tax=Pseudodesulfovibrio aespoeensis (strain ATCC 700646 / DSM 10631 / Aspo-2) TaxID=643562 RepID=E6VVQ2_PSEA9|nr:MULTISPECIES: FAD-dependent oxidoreductase [Pseudodesulfovibrio]MBU4245092.1 FAD-dependent oxidoreductase [Pseudomonadota bacterium]MCG2733470.1 FAD-dependent oxidoreductase [Pseudodesulfovibrio aespoeensis]ADU61254.1 amine oxidase [Pseudodesulfovibrio aespoeensis Aspo-2]MBU4378751.1 FAD-dependent oxidoreductase [Pseudomonadota bacterium]MBU4474310.1 FAD-dependent oxidoreductase [Pseudomonadota bacterium]